MIVTFIRNSNNITIDTFLGGISQTTQVVYQISRNLDFIFIVDGSDNMASYFDSVKAFMISMISMFDMSGGNIRVGIVLNGGRQYVVAELNKKSSLEDYKQTIQNMRIVGGNNANFLDGLRWAYKSLTNPSNTASAGSSWFAWVFVISASNYRPIGAEMTIANDIRKRGL